MRAVVQRVKRAEVLVGQARIGSIESGILALVGITPADTPSTGATLAEKILNLRIFDDAARRMNRSLLETGGGILCVPQFTLFGDCRKGRRPNYSAAAPPEIALPLYHSFLESVRHLAAGAGVRVESGQFQAMMQVQLVNDGPVTLLLDTDKVF